MMKYSDLLHIDRTAVNLIACSPVDNDFDEEKLEGFIIVYSDKGDPTQHFNTFVESIEYVRLYERNFDIFAVIDLSTIEKGHGLTDEMIKEMGNE